MGNTNGASETSHGDRGRMGTPFAMAIISFWETLQALRDLVESIGPVARDLDSYDRIGEEFASFLPPTERERFLEGWQASREERVDENEEDQTHTKAGEDIKWEELFAKAREVDDPFLTSAVLGLARLRRRAPRSFYVYQSLLTMAVGSFEVLLGRVWSSFFAAKPEMLDDQEKRFSLADLAEFDSLEDALDYAIERRVDSLLLASFEHWAEWFSRQKITDFSESAISWTSIREVVQRRHVVVHNGGRVSRRYKEQLGAEADELDVGSVLWTDEKYLNDALDQLIVLGTQVAAGAWLKLHPEERDDVASFVLIEVVYQLMLSERWHAVAHLSRRTREVASEDYTYWALQCNEWHSRKELDGIESVRAEIEDWDTSALSGLFQLVKACLLDDLDEAFDLLPGLLSIKELDREALRTWPILAPLRDDARYLLISRDETEEE